MENKGWNYRAGRIVNGVMQMIQQEFQPRKCKYCGSYHVVRFGRSKDTHQQRLLCRDCNKTFMDTDSLPGMKTPQDQVASALNMYYEGMSLNAIRRHLQQMYNNYPSDSTVYEWIDRFTKQAVKQTKEYRPDVGDIWVADETVLKIGGQKVWFWDLIDAKTRYLLASHLSTTRTTTDARILMMKAARKAEKPPKQVITDQLAAYIDGIELNFGGDTKHIAAKNLRTTPGTQLIERFHSTLKARTKVMRGLKSLDSARNILQGWLVHYNYLRPHEALGNKTPAQKAGIKYPFENWRHIVNIPSVSTSTVNEPLITKRPRISQPTPRISPRTPRITPRVPRISPKTPKLGKNELYVGRGMVSKRYFKGAKRRRLY